MIILLSQLLNVLFVSMHHHQVTFPAALPAAIFAMKDATESLTNANVDSCPTYSKVWLIILQT